MLNFNKAEKMKLIELLKKDGESKTNNKLIKRIENSMKQIKPRSAKSKGAEWEKEIALCVSNITGIKYDQQDDNCLIHAREMGLSGVDVILRGKARDLFPFDIECKNCNNVSLPAWIQQAENNCTGLNNWLLFIKSPVLSCKKVVVMALSKFEELGKEFVH